MSWIQHLLGDEPPRLVEDGVRGITAVQEYVFYGFLLCAGQVVVYGLRPY